MGVKSRILSVVAMMSWMVGVVFLMLAAALAYSDVIDNQLNRDLAINVAPYFVLAFLFIVAGWGTWKQKKPFNYISLLVFISAALFSVKSGLVFSIVGIPLSILLAILLVSRWHAFT
jgi:hypothetical protein